MKFLIFNLAVGAALVYLVTADRGDMHSAADRLYDATQGARSVVSRAADGGRELFGRNDDGATAAAPALAHPRAADAAAPVAPSEPRAAVTATPPDAVAAGPDLLAPPPVPSPGRVAAASRGGDAPPTPEALRRRDLILGDAAAPAPAAPALAPEERRRQLYSLAEEMELFYARSLSR